VLRTPVGGRFQSNANDRHVDTRSLLRWEYSVTRHLDSLGFPAAADGAAVGDLLARRISDRFAGLAELVDDLPAAPPVAQLPARRRGDAGLAV
jgi:hypothetical protein